MSESPSYQHVLYYSVSNPHWWLLLQRPTPHERERQVLAEARADRKYCWLAIRVVPQEPSSCDFPTSIFGNPRCGGAHSGALQVFLGSISRSCPEGSPCACCDPGHSTAIGLRAVPSFKSSTRTIISVAEWKTTGWRPARNRSQPDDRRWRATPLVLATVASPDWRSRRRNGTFLAAFSALSTTKLPNPDMRTSSPIT